MPAAARAGVLLAAAALGAHLLFAGWRGGGGGGRRVHNGSSDVDLFRADLAGPAGPARQAWGSGGWPVRQTFVGMPEILLPPQLKHDCTAAPRSMSDVLPGSIRPRRNRVVIDAQCAPAPDALDSGMCLQFSSAKRKLVACLPSLIILGFQKCGTGELQGWLSAHPTLQRWQGNEPKKSGAGEADYFNRQATSDGAVAKTWITSYLKAGFVLFKASDIARVYTFEKSPNYGHMDTSRIRQMHRMLPSVRLIALVREPAGRAYSGFQHTCYKGRVFEIDAAVAGIKSKSRARNLVRRALAGRVIIAENVSQAVEGLFLRFGRFAVFADHIRQLQYPCSPKSFDNFMMLPANTTAGASGAAAHRGHLGGDVAESLLDVRGQGITTVLTHGLYFDALSRYASVYPRSQMLVVFTEELQADTLGALDSVQSFLGIPRFDYRPFAHKNARGNVAATFQRSKTVASTYLPMSTGAQQALAGYYARPNEQLAGLLKDDRVARLWAGKTPV